MLNSKWWFIDRSPSYFWTYELLLFSFFEFDTSPGLSMQFSFGGCWSRAPHVDHGTRSRKQHGSSTVHESWCHVMLYAREITALYNSIFVSYIFWKMKSSLTFSSVFMNFFHFTKFIALWNTKSEILPINLPVGMYSMIWDRLMVHYSGFKHEETGIVLNW